MNKLFALLLLVFASNVSAAEKLTCDKFDNPNLDLSSVRGDLENRIANLDSLINYLNDSSKLLSSAISDEQMYVQLAQTTATIGYLSNSTFTVVGALAESPALIGTALVKSVADITVNAINASNADETIKQTLTDLGLQQADLMGSGVAKSLGKKTVENSIGSAFAAIDLIRSTLDYIDTIRSLDTHIDKRQLNVASKQIKKYTNDIKALKKELAAIDKKLSPNKYEAQVEKKFLKVISGYNKQSAKMCKSQAIPPVIKSIKTRLAEGKIAMDVSFTDASGDGPFYIEFDYDGTFNYGTIDGFSKAQLAKGVVSSWNLFSCPAGGGIYNFSVWIRDQAGNVSNHYPVTYNCVMPLVITDANSRSVDSKIVLDVAFKDSNGNSPYYIQMDYNGTYSYATIDDYSKAQLASGVTTSWSVTSCPVNGGVVNFSAWLRDKANNLSNRFYTSYSCAPQNGSGSFFNPCPGAIGYQC